MPDYCGDVWHGGRANWVWGKIDPRQWLTTLSYVSPLNQQSFPHYHIFNNTTPKNTQQLSPLRAYIQLSPAFWIIRDGCVFCGESWVTVSIVG